MTTKVSFLEHVKTHALKRTVEAAWTEQLPDHRSPVVGSKKEQDTVRQNRRRINHECLPTFNRLPKTLCSSEYVSYHDSLHWYFPVQHPPHIYFWRPSFVAPRTTTLFLNNPLFFKDNRNEGAIIRHLSVNEWGNAKSLPAVLEKLHVGTAFKKAYPRLDEANVYLMRGEVEARDHLVEWLKHACSDAKIECHYRSAHASLHPHHCVLMGNWRMSLLLRGLYQHKEYKVALRVEMVEQNIIHIRGPFSKQEEDTLKKCGATKLSRSLWVFYDFGGIPPKSPKAAPDPREKWAHVVITRLANPDDRGTVTMFSSNHNAAVERTMRIFTGNADNIQELNTGLDNGLQALWTTVVEHPNRAFQSVVAWELKHHGKTDSGLLSAHDLDRYRLVFHNEYPALSTTF